MWSRQGIGSPAFGTISTEKCTTSGPSRKDPTQPVLGLVDRRVVLYQSRGAADYLFAVVAGQLRERLVDEAEDAGLVDDVRGTRARR